MKFTHEQRLEMAQYGVDPDQMENPKQRLPSVDERIAKLERKIKEKHPRRDEYQKKLKVYKVLQGKDNTKNRSFFKRFFGG